jgi:hypothetical protein
MANEAGAEQVVELTPEQRIEEKLFKKFEEPEPEIVKEPVEESEAELEVESEAESDEVVEVEAESEEELFEHELDGQVYEVPKAIHEAMLRNDDYTQKTQETAAQRDKLTVVQSEAELKNQQHQFLESVRDETTKAENINWQIDQLRDYMRTNIDTLTGNQLEKVRWQMDELNTEKNGIVQALSVKWQEHQQAAEQTRKELRDNSTEVLKGQIPSWGPEAEKQSLEYGLSVGFTEDEINSSVDPRERQVLWEAAQYRRLKQGKAAAVGKVAAAPKIRTSARRTTSDDTKRKISVRKQLNSTSDPKAKAKIIQADLEKRLGL